MASFLGRGAGVRHRWFSDEMLSVLDPEREPATAQVGQ
jgi:hypothetical protein